MSFAAFFWLRLVFSMMRVISSFCILAWTGQRTRAASKTKPVLTLQSQGKFPTFSRLIVWAGLTFPNGWSRRFTRNTV